MWVVPSPAESSEESSAIKSAAADADKQPACNADDNAAGVAFRPWRYVVRYKSNASSVSVAFERHLAAVTFPL